MNGCVCETGQVVLMRDDCLRDAGHKMRDAAGEMRDTVGKIRDAAGEMQDAGRGVWDRDVAGQMRAQRSAQDAGRRTRDAECEMRDAAYKMLRTQGVGHSVRDVGCGGRDAAGCGGRDAGPMRGCKTWDAGRGAWCTRWWSDISAII